MKAEFAATSSSDAEERPGIGAEIARRQAGADLPKDAYGFGAFVEVILANLKLLLLGPAIAGLVAFGIASVLPKSYTSVVYLSFDEAAARIADARMRSTHVLDKVLAGFNAPQATLEARRRYIEENRRIVVAAGDTQKTSKLFRMEYSNGDPVVAQKVNSLLIEAWLESTKPQPDGRAVIEAEIERVDAQAKSISRMIERLEKDSPSLVAQQSLQGELATPILNLIAKRDENLSNLITLRNSLNGISRDVIFGAPDLPEEPSWPRRGMITVLAVTVTALLLLLFVIVRRFRPTWI
jgi:uncharacterized protein involved in exopolysaccharide biosynthesis